MLATELASLSRAAIADVIDRSVPWVNAAILRVQLRMHRDPRFRSKVEQLGDRLRASLRQG